MIKKITLVILALINILALIYLVSPAPSLPDLPNSVKSDLPGDTVQIKDTTALFTNMTRTEVINFYKASFSGPFRIIINHPPEKARQIWQETTQSYYLEEFILPFKQSLYINGFEWEKDVFIKPEQRIKNKILYQDKEYQAKVTLRLFPAKIGNRIFVFFLTEGLFIFSFLTYKKFLSHR